MNEETTRIVRLDTEKSITPVSHFLDDQGQHVYEFQIPKHGTDIHVMDTPASKVLDLDVCSPPIPPFHQQLPENPSVLPRAQSPPQVESNPTLEINSRTTPGPYTSTPPSWKVVQDMMDFTITDDPIINGNQRHKCKVWLCKMCGKYFREKANLVAHIYIHLGYRQHTCSACEKGFFHRSSLINHVRTECVFGKPINFGPDADIQLTN